MRYVFLFRTKENIEIIYTLKDGLLNLCMSKNATVIMILKVKFMCILSI